MATTLRKRTYTLEMLRDEVASLINQGKVSRQQPIYTLCRYISDQEWECVELDLEEHEYLLRDRIIDLLSNEVWQND